MTGGNLNVHALEPPHYSGHLASRCQVPRLAPHEPHAVQPTNLRGTRAPGVSRVLCERRSESTHVCFKWAHGEGAGGSGRGCDPATHRADVLLGVAVEVVEEQPVADKHCRHDGKHPRPTRKIGEDPRVVEVSPHRQWHRRTGEMPAPAQQGAQKEARSAGREVCRARGLQGARSAGREVCRARGLQGARSAGREVCRARGVRGARSAGREVRRRQGTRTRASYRRGVEARAGW